MKLKKINLSLILYCNESEMWSVSDEDVSHGSSLILLLELAQFTLNGLNKRCRWRGLWVAITSGRSDGSSWDLQNSFRTMKVTSTKRSHQRRMGAVQAAAPSAIGGRWWLSRMCWFRCLLWLCRGWSLRGVVRLCRIAKERGWFGNLPLSWLYFQDAYLGSPAEEPRCSRFVVRRLLVKSREGNGMGRSSWLAYICMAPSSRPS